MRCKRASLRALQDGVAQAGELLKTDCPTYRPVTSVVRIDVMEQRLDAMLRAINIVQPALQKIYGSLTDGQKERVNRDQRNASSAGSLVSAGCGSSQTTGHGHGLPSVAMNSQFSGFRASLFWVKITELERPRRHPKAFGTSSNLLSGTPSSVPLRRMSRERSAFNGWLFSSRAIREEPNAPV